jgi:hypothetical protein
MAIALSWPRLRFLAKVAATISPFLLVAFIGWQLWLYDGGVFETGQFVESKWKKEPAGSDVFECYRGGMAADLQNRVLTKGMTRDAVRQLLGEPNKEASGALEYNLGFCSKVGVDLDTLDIDFDERNELQHVRVRQH